MSAPATLVWFARHELMLSWRDWLALMTGGRRRRGVVVAIAILVLAVVMHLLAYHLIGPDRSVRHRSGPLDPHPRHRLRAPLLVADAVAGDGNGDARVLCARRPRPACSPRRPRRERVFAVRIMAIALSTTALAVPLAAPFINVLAYAGGPRWLGAYGVVDRDGDRGLGAGDGADGRAVPHARAAADALRGAGRRGGRRRDLRHRRAGGRDPLHQHAVAFRSSPVRPSEAGRARRRQCVLVAGARHHGRPARASSASS